MSTDSRIDDDLKALADASARGLPTLDDTARELSRAQRNAGGIMRTIKRPLFATAIGLCAVAVVLVLPVPYTHTVGYDLNVAGADGRVATLHLKAKNAAQAEARADAI